MEPQDEVRHGRRRLGLLPGRDQEIIVDLEVRPRRVADRDVGLDRDLGFHRGGILGRCRPLRIRRVRYDRIDVRVRIPGIVIVVGRFRPARFTGRRLGFGAGQLQDPLVRSRVRRHGLLLQSLAFEGILAV